ncbi:MAG TPA: aldehyde dehydrogenase [Arcobacter sp.]|nr:aldehyde dehydrogenase [Arcobacter sp.]
MLKNKLYINGEWINGSIEMDSVNPETDEIIGKVYCAESKDVKASIVAAKEALNAWSNLDVRERAKYLTKASDILVEKYGEEGKETPLKKIIVDEVGKRLPEADIEVIESSDMLGYFATAGVKLLVDENLQLNEELWATKRSYVTHDPVGVVGIIQPWNYPLELPLWAIGAALIAGNTIVFKPSEYSSLVGLEIAKIFEDAGLPKGVLNVITGDASTGKAIVSNNNIDMISFTGSYQVGKEINIKCAESFKKTNLELSGNDAAIVLDDADLELTANGIVWGSYCNSGQVCVGAKRIFVHDEIYDDFIKLVTEKTINLKLGIDIGPIINKNELQKIKSLVDEAIDKGAILLQGGNINDNFFEPTILSNVDFSMQLMKDELFGPILPIIRFSSTEEVIELANNTQYGLGASIWTQNLALAKSLSKQLNVGMVWINDINIAYPEAPWGSIKASGNGISLSKYGIEKYTNIKHINYETGKDPTRPWWFPYS